MIDPLSIDGEPWADVVVESCGHRIVLWASTSPEEDSRLISVHVVSCPVAIAERLRTGKRTPVHLKWRN